MRKVKLFVARWLYKITNSKRWVRLYVDLLNEQIKEEIEEVYHDFA